MLKKSPTNMSSGAGDISLPDVSKLNDLKDDQIEALIEKLAEVQAHAPQIIAALEAQQEARSRGSRGSERKGGNSDRGERTQPPRQQQQQQQQQEEEDGDDYDEDEDDDEFDEDAEYPMVGDGYSDELSVVSDMTTPTVVSSLEINEEEYYRDMMVGSGMKMTAPKKKDMLSQVAKANARKGPVATAAQAKKKVGGAGATDTALKKPARVASMHATPRQDKVAAAAGASPAAAGAKEGKKKKTKEAGTTPTGTKKVKKKTVKKKATSPSNTGSGWGDANGGAAAAAGGPSTTNKKKGPQQDKAAAPAASAPVMIDDDGFLVDQSTFETFDSSNNPFARAPSFTADANAAAADDAFGAFANFGETDPAPAPPTKKSSKPKKLNVNSTGSKKKNSGTGSVSSPKQKRKGTRRASLTG